MSANFDNIADEQSLSPTLLESYLNAAGESAAWRWATATRRASITPIRTPSYVSQHPWDHVEGAPFGTRGGWSSITCSLRMASTFRGDPQRRRQRALRDIDISIDGERVALLPYETGRPAARTAAAPAVMTEPVVDQGRAAHGRRGVRAALRGSVRGSDSPARLVVCGGGSGGGGITTCRTCATSSFRARSRRRAFRRRRAAQVFTCRPTSRDEELRCARELTRLATEAYRRPLTPRETDRLMPFYQKGAAQGGFEGGVRASLEAVLSSPSFIFRLEREPEATRAGSAYRVADRHLASRLSFFLWGTLPDKELLTRRGPGPAVPIRPILERQARRLLADSRAEALAVPLCRRSGCAFRTSTRSSRIQTSIRTSTTTSRRMMRKRDRAFLLQPHLRGLQSPRAVQTPTTRS